MTSVQNNLIDTLFNRFTGLADMDSSNGGGDSPVQCCSYCSRPSSDSSLTTLDCGLHRVCSHCYSMSLNNSGQSIINSRKNSDTDSCTSAKINKHLMSTISEASASIESSSSVSSTDENNLDERFKKSNALKCKLCSLMTGNDHAAQSVSTVTPPLSSSPSNLIFNRFNTDSLLKNNSLANDEANSNSLLSNFR